MRSPCNAFLGFVLLLMAAGYAHGQPSKRISTGLDAAALLSNIKYPRDAVASGTSGKVLVYWYPEQRTGPEHVVILPGKSAALIDAVRRGLLALYPNLPIKTAIDASVGERRYDITFRLDSAKGKVVGRVDILEVAMVVDTPHDVAVSVATPRVSGKELGAPSDAKSVPAKPDTAHPSEPDEFVNVDEEPILDQADLRRRLVYPEDAKKGRIEGRVLVRVLVNKFGNVVDVHIDHTDSPMLTSAAVDALRGTHFIPAQQKGNPVAVWVQIPVDFKLQ